MRKRSRGVRRIQITNLPFSPRRYKVRTVLTPHIPMTLHFPLPNYSVSTDQSRQNKSSLSLCKLDTIPSFPNRVLGPTLTRKSYLVLVPVISFDSFKKEIRRAKKKGDTYSKRRRVWYTEEEFGVKFESSFLRLTRYYIQYNWTLLTDPGPRSQSHLPMRLVHLLHHSSFRSLDTSVPNCVFCYLKWGGVP